MGEHIVESHQFDFDGSDGAHAPVPVVRFADCGIEGAGGDMADLHLPAQSQNADVSQTDRPGDEKIFRIPGLRIKKCAILPPEEEAAMESSRPEKPRFSFVIAEAFESSNAFFVRHHMERILAVSSRSSSTTLPPERSEPPK
jgi:hypothetical protein